MREVESEGRQTHAAHFENFSFETLVGVIDSLKRFEYPRYEYSCSNIAAEDRGRELVGPEILLRVVSGRRNSTENNSCNARSSTEFSRVLVGKKSSCCNFSSRWFLK